jgi:hypothetical protein
VGFPLGIYLNKREQARDFSMIIKFWILEGTSEEWLKAIVLMVGIGLVILMNLEVFVN